MPSLTKALTKADLRALGIDRNEHTPQDQTSNLLAQKMPFINGAKLKFF